MQGCQGTPKSCLEFQDSRSWLLPLGDRFGGGAQGGPAGSQACKRAERTQQHPEGLGAGSASSSREDLWLVSHQPRPPSRAPKAGDGSDLPRPALSLPDARGRSGHPRPLNRPAEPLLPGSAHRDARGSPTARACLGPGSQEQEITERGTEKEDRESWQRRSRGSGGTWWLGGQSAEPVPGD